MVFRETVAPDPVRIRQETILGKKRQNDKTGAACLERVHISDVHWVEPQHLVAGIKHTGSATRPNGKKAPAAATTRAPSMGAALIDSCRKKAADRKWTELVDNER